MSRRSAYLLLTKKNIMAKKLYVGGLNYSTTDATLKAAFQAAGTVESATIIIDKMTNRSKGFGFVEMSTDEEAQKAIEMFDGKELDGRTVKVNEAKPMEPRAPRTGGYNHGGNDRGGFGGGNRW
ncbi:MAG: RNA-binding protein [Candidatus Staskawiczbacteria bacterium]|nr:RNA-binding protein [Candidatus Staskawiczbacteria bacterium]